MGATKHRPFTGARIETLDVSLSEEPIEIAPSRGRGLKPSLSIQWPHTSDRPFTGARIETLKVLYEG